MDNLLCLAMTWNQNLNYCSKEYEDVSKPPPWESVPALGPGPLQPSVLNEIKVKGSTLCPLALFDLFFSYLVCVHVKMSV